MVDRELNQLTALTTLLPTDLLYVGRGVDEDYKVSTEVLRTFAGAAVQPWARDPAIGLVPASNIDPLIARVSQIPSSVMPTIYGAGAPNAAQGQNGSTYLDTRHWQPLRQGWRRVGPDHRLLDALRRRPPARISAPSPTRGRRVRHSGATKTWRYGRTAGRWRSESTACG